MDRRKDAGRGPPPVRTSGGLGLRRAPLTGRLAKAFEGALWWTALSSSGEAGAVNPRGKRGHRASKGYGT